MRQLGSIYEGLLEFKVRVAAEKMAVVKGQRTEEVVPYREAVREKRRILTKGRGKDAPERVLTKGAVYLENDKRERKATGSYYTPDHIVRYIVEHAVGPVLERKFEAMRPRLRQAQQERRAFFQKQEEFRRRAMKAEPDGKAELIGQELVGELFDVKVLDPAMGSGHFLVEAVDFITDRTLDFLNAFPWNPVRAELARTRESILQEMDEQGVSIDPARLIDVGLLKRHVLKRCIYGVDLNPMAVELAKVSLWLDCFTLGALLSFLDHHLRCGNSLIAATVAEVQEALDERQSELLGSRFAGLLSATELMRHVGELSDVTGEQVRQSRTEFRHASDALLPFKRILDIYASQWFGNGAPSRGSETSALALLQNRQVDAVLNARTGEEIEAALAKLPPSQQIGRKTLVGERDVARTALTAAREKSFFHWELEFPEVFFGARPGTERTIERREGAGFDAVIGNPPYDEPSAFYSDTARSVSDFLSNYSAYQPFKNGRLNLYRIFILRGLEQVKSQGVTSFIVPLSVLADEFSRPVREFLIHQHALTRVEAFPQKDDPRQRVFPEAKLSTCILVVQANASVPEIQVRMHPGRFIEPESPAYDTSSAELSALFTRIVIPLVDEREWVLLRRAFAHDDWKRLSDVADVYVGEIFDNAPNKQFLSDEPVGPVVLRGANLDRYLLRENPSQGSDRYLRDAMFVTARSGSEKLRLLEFDRVGLQRGAAVDNWRRLIACRIPAGFYSFDTVLLIRPFDIDLRVLLGLVNSDLWEWRFRCTSTTNHVNVYEMEEFRIPPVLLDERRSEVAQLSELVDLLSDNNAAPVRRADTQQVPNDSSDLRIDDLVFRSYGLDGATADQIRSYLQLRR